MKRKSYIIIGGLILIVLIGFALCRIKSYNQTFGLSEDVIGGSVKPDAEETVRLYLYYCNRGEWKAADELTTGYMTYKIWFPSIHLLSLKYVGVFDDKSYCFNVIYNEAHIYAPTSENDNTIDFDFNLIETEGGWKITAIGNG